MVAHVQIRVRLLGNPRQVQVVAVGVGRVVVMVIVAVDRMRVDRGGAVGVAPPRPAYHADDVILPHPADVVVA